jgi:hypothetical protein
MKSENSYLHSQQNVRHCEEERRSNLSHFETKRLLHCDRNDVRVEKRNYVRYLFLLYFSLFTLNSSLSQNVNYARKIIDTLSSETFHGRGYTLNGDKLSAEFIKSELKKMNVKSFDTSYFQTVKISANTFPTDVEISIDGKKLKAGTEFVLFPHTTKCSGKYEIVYLDKQIITDRYKFKTFLTANHKKHFLAIDTTGVRDKEILKVIEYVSNYNILKAKGIITVHAEHLHAGISSQVGTFAGLRISNSVISKNSKSISINLKPKFLKDYKSQNVIAFVEGKTDTMIVFSAHYDHLGAIGNQTYIPGANDNASGNAMLLDLAKYYSNLQEKPKYSIAFIFFTGEEIGLFGSKYFTENPVFPLSKIKFLFNLDMVGTGEDGIMIVNGKINKKQTELLNKINDENKYLCEIALRGKASNSDHHYFHEKGVPCFFIFTQGGIGEYHNVWDISKTLPLTEYEDLFRLLTKFVEIYE